MVTQAIVAAEFEGAAAVAAVVHLIRVTEGTRGAVMTLTSDSVKIMATATAAFQLCYIRTTNDDDDFGFRNVNNF